MTPDRYLMIEAFEGALDDLHLQRFGLTSELRFWMTRRTHYEDRYNHTKDHRARFFIRHLINRSERMIGLIRSNIGTAENNIDFFDHKFEQFLRGNE